MFPSPYAERAHRHDGFSLVELSIVLVILGLLVGGILGGQSLIKAAELRAITTEYEQWQRAMLLFKERYGALPGDMPNAIRFWGNAQNGSFSGQCSNPATAQGSGAQTCNGDGNGLIGGWGNSGATASHYEIFRFWQHLANAGMITGTYTGRRGSGGDFHHTTSNSPASKYSGAGWAMESLETNFTGNALFYGGNYRNYLEFGAFTSNSCHDSPVLTPEHAWSIDSKLDDGMPGQGQIMAGNWQDCSHSQHQNDIGKHYALDESQVSCFMIFKLF